MEHLYSILFLLQIVYSTPSIPGIRLNMPLIAAINGTELGSGCIPFTSDIKGKVVLVLRGGCLFAVKVKSPCHSGFSSSASKMTKH